MWAGSDQQDKLDWVEGGGPLKIVSGAHRRRRRPTRRRLVRPGPGFGHGRAPRPQGGRSHRLGHRRPGRPRPRRGRASGWLASSHSLVLARLELSLWDSQPQIADAIQVGSDHLSPTVNATGWASRSTGVIDVPAGARWLRIGWGCPVSTQTQYACAEDLVPSVVIGSEPGTGGGVSARRQLPQVCV
jgi:hypothetical protein